MEGNPAFTLHTLNLLETSKPPKQRRGLLLKDLHFKFIKYHMHVVGTASTSIENYCYTFSLLTQFKPDITTSDLTEECIVNFFEFLNTRKRKVGREYIVRQYKKSSMAGVRSKLNIFFVWLKERRFIALNPFDNIKYPHVTYTDARAFTPKEIEKILNAVNTKIHWATLLIKKRNIAIIMFLLFTGVRKNELLSIKLSDVDFDRKVVYVRSYTSKSKRGRIIPLNIQLLPYLEDYLLYRRAYTCEFLWISGTSDSRFTAFGIKHFIKILSKVTKVNCHLHRARHTFAIAFYKATHDILGLKKLMGHSSLAMTLTYLRSLGDDHIIDQIKKLSINHLRKEIMKHH